MTRELRDRGFTVGRSRTARRMRDNGLRVRQKRRFKRTTDSEHVRRHSSLDFVSPATYERQAA
jgi:putative transposase